MNKKQSLMNNSLENLKIEEVTIFALIPTIKLEGSREVNERELKFDRHKVKIVYVKPLESDRLIANLIFNRFTGSPLSLCYLLSTLFCFFTWHSLLKETIPTMRHSHQKPQF
ncbi:hypothetical protein V7O62_13720 [Methanolobus sp. ZRKC2]|uniref:hypothetical protein n=1 Tax=Methanolobus sp. ZRKC2 TaxID=3125783 RepID=UPI00324C8667